MIDDKLIKNYNTIIETLEKEIWQHSSELETHTVETHIYRLRKKIKAEFGNDELIISNKDGYTI